MSENVTKVFELINIVKECDAKLNEIQTIRDDSLKKAQELCGHPASIDKVYHNNGSYYDKAYTVTETFCAICGKKISTYSETHSYYG